MPYGVDLGLRGMFFVTMCEVVDLGGLAAVVDIFRCVVAIAVPTGVCCWARVLVFLLVVPFVPRLPDMVHGA